MSSTTSAEPVPTTDRAPGGRFAKNNPGGPGNPFARQTAALRAYLINHVTERDLEDILQILLLNAKAGHLPTIKFLFSYVLGKPKPVVEPDLLDLQEMQLMQQSALPPEALETVCAQLPLDFQVQLMRFGQGMNEVHAAQEASAALADKEDTTEPCTDPSVNGDNGAARCERAVAVPSTDGENGEPQAATRTARRSTNGENRHRPKLPGFDWLREFRRAAKPPGSRPKA